MSKILVTGGAGFIGSHLCEALLKREHRVIALDNFFTSSERNVEHLLDDDNFELVRGDVCEPFHYDVDQIYHLACPASPMHYQRNPVRTIQTGILGTLHALWCARDACARLVITSTSEVYGDPLVHPQPESYVGSVSCTGPRACYDESKRCGEALATSFAQQYGTDVRTARLFNTYGPRMAKNDGRLIPNFLEQARNGEPLTVYGDGKQTRSFCYVSDTVAGLLALMNNPTRIPVVNIGNPDERTILSVAEQIADQFGGVGFDFRPLPQDDPRQRCPDITLAKEALGWRPIVPFASGLAETIRGMR